jgi:hypothetical protein
MKNNFTHNIILRISGRQCGKLIFILLFGTMTLFTMAQAPGPGYSLQHVLNQLSSAESLSEKVIMHTDRPLYIAGENIWYKIYCLNADDLPSDLSQAVYVELLNQENQQIIAQVIHLSKGSGNGVIEIPGSLASGVYYLRAYTAWMKNAGPDQFFLKILKIFNPFQELPDQPLGPNTPYKSILEKGEPGIEYPFPPVQTELQGLQSISGNDLNLVKLTIDSLKQNYKNRDRVAVNLKLSGLQGIPLLSDLSVAVVLDDEENPRKDPPVHISDSTTLRNLYLDDWTGAEMQMIIPVDSSLPWKRHSIATRDSIFLPEPEGLVLSGSVINKIFHAPEMNKGVYLSWVGGTRDVRFTLTNSDGRFFFRLPEGEENRTAILQVPACNDESLLITDNQFSQKFVRLQPFIFNLPEYSKNYLEQLLLNFQVSLAYGTREKQMVRVKPGPDFYGRPDEKYTLENYIKLPVMEEFFRELVKSTILTREKGSYKINVLDRNLNRIIGPDPGYLIDGVPVFRSSMILESDPQVFKEIRVVNRRYLYGNISWDGIIDFSTSTGDFGDFDLPPVSARQTIKLFEPRVQYVPVEYDTPVSRSSKLPDYRTVLLWKPDLKTDPEGSLSFDFTTSDVTGRYRMVIRGITSTGQPIFLERAFHVGSHPLPE